MSQEDDNDVLSSIREVHVSKPSDQVVEQLLRLITTGMLKPGDILPPERELTKRFGISRNYVREGIKTLELYGLLNPVQGRGTTVTDSGIRGLGGVLKTVLKLTHSDLQSLLDTRILLETETARLAAERADADDRKELRDCLDEWRSQDTAGGSLRCDIKVHIRIADISRNAVMASLVRLITPEIIHYYRDFRNDNSIGTFGIHQQVVESIVAGDGAKASEYMREHLLDSRSNFMEAINRRNSVRMTSK